MFLLVTSMFLCFRKDVQRELKVDMLDLKSKHQEIDWMKGFQSAMKPMLSGRTIIE